MIAENVSPLNRPEKLKRWAGDLLEIVEKDKETAFDGWEFGPGRLTRVDLAHSLKKIRNCGTLLELRSKFDRETGEMTRPEVHAGNYCGQHTICPVCAGRVQDRRGARFSEPIKKAAARYPFAYLITATIPPRESWREDLDQLIKGWQNLRRMGQRRPIIKKKKVVGYRPGHGEWSKVRAALAKVEIKRGADSDLPHCHYHALVFTDELIDFRVWSKEEKKKERGDRVSLYQIKSNVTGEMVAASKMSWEWNKATGGASSFDVEMIRHKLEHKKKGISLADSVWLQSREVLKYCTKFDSRPEKGHERLFIRDFVSIKDATYNRRLFSTYGAFREVGGDDFTGDIELSDDPLFFEARWKGLRYSNLILKSMPVFKDRDGLEESRQRLTAANKAQGLVRRIRGAVFRAKEHWRTTGQIIPAVYRLPDFAECDESEAATVALEPPKALVDSPSLAGFEDWMDQLMAAGREYYAAAVDRIRLEGLIRLDGTPEERARWNDLTARVYANSPEGEARTIRLFVTTLQARPGPW